MRMPRLNQYKPRLMTTTPFVSKLQQPTRVQPNPSFGNRGFIIPYTPSPDASIDYTNEPQTSFFDKFDPQALEDLAGLTPPERQQGKVLPAPGISRGDRHGGAEIPLSKEYDHTYAPNPGLALFVPEKEKNRFAGMS